MERKCLELPFTSLEMIAGTQSEWYYLCAVHKHVFSHCVGCAPLGSYGTAYREVIDVVFQFNGHLLGKTILFHLKCDTYVHLKGLLSTHVRLKWVIATYVHLKGLISMYVHLKWVIAT